MTNFVYDPKRQGYDTSIWKTLTGAPAVAADKIVLNQDEIIGYGDLYECDLIMHLIIPAVPTAGDVRSFGLSSAGLGALLVFDITDDVFSIKSNDGHGGTKSVTVDFAATWATAETCFEIRWRGDYADFIVDGVKVIDATSASAASYRLGSILGATTIPKGPLSIYLKNTNNDDMKVVSIEARNIQTFI